MFDIPVKVEGIEKRRRSVGLFHILTGLFLSANASLLYKHLNYTSLWMLLPIYAVSLASIFYGLFRKRLDVANKYNRWLRVIQLLIFLVLASNELRSGSSIRSISLFLWAGISLALLITERLLFNYPSIKLSTDGISTPGSITMRKIGWNDLESVVVRQDFITLNYNNKKEYLQFEISAILTGTEIERINLFCNEQLSKAELQKERIAGN